MTKCGPNTCNECGYNLGLSENWALIITQRLIIFPIDGHFEKRSDLSHFETNDWDIPLQIPHKTPKTRGETIIFSVKPPLFDGQIWSNHH